MFPTTGGLLLALLPAPQVQVSAESLLPICPTTVRDTVTGACLEASATPGLGRLFTLTPDLMVDATTGHVGIGTTSPGATLDVAGAVIVGGSWPFAQLSVEAVGASDGIYVSSSATFGTALIASAAGDYSKGLDAFALGASSDAVRATVVGMNSYAVAGYASSLASAGVVGEHTSPNPGEGVRGFTDPGVGGGSFDTNRGVLGQVRNGIGTGVWGEGNATSGSDGVKGISNHPSGYGVYALGLYGAHALVAVGTSTGQAVLAQGNLTCTGIKNFVHPHPTDPAREIRFVCLEGNESGTYFRGASRLIGGRVVVPVPEEFRMVSAPSDLTVQLTAVGARADLWVESVDLLQVVVRGAPDVDFNYQVNGVRAGYEDYEVLHANRSFQPRVAGVPYGEHLSPVARETLVRNGVLNADYTPNRATADRLGWQLTEEVEMPPRPERPVAPRSPTGHGRE